MKKISIAIALCFTLAMASMAMAVEWHSANSSTLAWSMDYTSPRPDGSTFTIPTEQIWFRVYRTPAANVNRFDPEFIKETQDLSHLVQFAEEGEYLLGVMAVRKVPNIQGEEKSVIAWSDDPESTNNKPFGVVFMIPPKAPVDIKVE